MTQFLGHSGQWFLGASARALVLAAFSRAAGHENGGANNELIYLPLNSEALAFFFGLKFKHRAGPDTIDEIKFCQALGFEIYQLLKEDPECPIDEIIEKRFPGTDPTKWDFSSFKRSTPSAPAAKAGRKRKAPLTEASNVSAAEAEALAQLRAGSLRNATCTAAIAEQYEHEPETDGCLAQTFVHCLLVDGDGAPVCPPPRSARSRSPAPAADRQGSHRRRRGGSAQRSVRGIRPSPARAHTARRSRRCTSRCAASQRAAAPTPPPPPHSRSTLR